MDGRMLVTVLLKVILSLNLAATENKKVRNPLMNKEINNKTTAS